MSVTYHQKIPRKILLDILMSIFLYDNLLSDIYRYQKRVLYMYVVISMVDAET